MTTKKSSIIKREQRKAFFLKEIAKMFRDIAADEPVLQSIFPTRADFSPGDGMCYVYFYSTDGKEQFKEVLNTLKLYKPSIRKAIASLRNSRYTPDIKFLYDDAFDKSKKVEELLEKAKEDIDKAS